MRSRLLLLALAPALAFALFAAYESWERWQTLRASERVVSRARDVQRAVAAKNDLTKEQAPINARLRAQGDLGKVAPAVAGILLEHDIVGDAVAGAAHADDALAALASSYPAAQDVAVRLRTARATGAAAHDPSEADAVGAAYDDAERALDRLIERIIADVGAEDVGGAQGIAVAERADALHHVLAALDAADLEILTLWRALAADGAVPRPLEQTLAGETALRRADIAEALRLAGPDALALAGREVAPADRRFDARIDDLLAHAGDQDRTRPGLLALGSLFGAGLTRQYAYYDLASAAADDMADDAASAAADARERLEAALLAALLVALGSTVLALLVARSLSRPLMELASAANDVGAGQLPETVTTGGGHVPREIAVVRDAFADMVRSLRALDGQAAALAERRLDDPTLSDTLPGPLGEHLHASVQALSTSIKVGEQLQRDLAEAAAHDGLTGLLNRGAALDHLGAALARTRATGEGVGVLFIDLDGFKRPNDHHGHAAGDRVLEEAAARLRAAARPGDVVARLGGDEFVVIAQPVSAADADALAACMVRALARPVLVEGTDVRVGASAGVAVCADGTATPAELLRQADVAGYRAKASGRGQVKTYDDDLRRDDRDRDELERAFARALGEGAITFAYQPILDANRGHVLGVEALARWTLPGRGPIPPDRFVAIAEASDLVIELGRHALRSAADQLVAWSDHPVLGGASAFVNISRRHVLSPRVVDDVAAVLDRTGLDPQRLVLEVTEGMLIDDDLATAAEHLARLKARGVRIAIDDFGTGYTSLAHLGRLPVDVLKIDRSFVRAIDEPRQRTLVRLVRDAARQLNLVFLAEGVETEEQLEELRRIGCDAVQGYLLGRPQPAADLARWASDEAAA